MAVPCVPTERSSVPAPAWTEIVLLGSGALGIRYSITHNFVLLLLGNDDLLSYYTDKWCWWPAKWGRAKFLVMVGHAAPGVCPTNIRATQKLLMPFVLEQGEMRLHLEALLTGNLHLPTGVGRPSVLTFSVQITYSAGNLEKRCFMFYSAEKNCLSVELWIPPWDADQSLSKTLTWDLESFCCLSQSSEYLLLCYH